MKNFIAKLFGLLGLTTKSDFEALQAKVLLLGDENRSLKKSNEEFNVKFQSLSDLRSDMATLYSEVAADIKRVDAKIGMVKPILKVEDPEAVDFIKEILSRHDKQITNQAAGIQTKILQLNSVEGKALAAIQQVKIDSAKLNNILNGLGLNDPSSEEFKNFKDTLSGKSEIVG